MIDGLQDRTRGLEESYPGLRFEAGLEGAVPVQAWGRVPSGDRFYFRWRGRRAGLTVGPPARVQPPTAAQLIERITGDVVEGEPEDAQHPAEVFPDGPRLVETTPVDDNLNDAVDVFHILFLRHQLQLRHR